MILTRGQKLGSYEVLSPIGAGGMGEVYRARDSRLGRDVAIKVLPSGVESDPDKLARFEREARLLASLNHPNIATLHGLDQSGGVHFLVMELIEGDTLTERLADGPLGTARALELFGPIAAALETAHAKGVVHRDLKPANIMITPEGAPKVLDFGLAKAFGAHVATSASSESPTIAKTATGVILGTAPYMSPEQARGKSLDKRTDIWSFGCALYEAMSGKPAFQGATVSDTLAAILEREPDWDALPASTPALIKRLLRRCLEKDPHRRLRDLGDAALEIEEALQGAAPTQDQPSVDRRVSVAMFTIALVAVVIALWTHVRTTPSPSPVVSRLVMTLPHDQKLVLGDRAYPLALSPNGSRLAYVAEVEGEPQLFVRELAEFDARRVPGTDGARYPFFSPDGQWIGFFADGKLHRVAVEAGRPVAIGDAIPGRGASWGLDGYIYFSASDGTGLRRVAAAGGTPEILSSQVPEMDRENHLWPHVLPDGRGLVSYYDGNLAILSFETMEWRVLGRGRQAQYLDDGYLVYDTFRSGRRELQVVPFDVDRQEVTGPPVSVLGGVYRAEGGGGSFFAASRSGTLVYVRGGMDRALVWVDREGRDRALTEDVRGFRMPKISPDGRHVAVIVDPRPSEVWVYDLERRTRWKLPHEGHHVLPVWAPDAQRITYYGGEREDNDMHSSSPDGTGEVEKLLERPGAQWPYSWSPDGKFLAFGEDHPTNSEDLWILPRDGEPFPVVTSPADETRVMFSPTGDWLAYMSNESGRYEVYVCSFPECRERQPISTAGGISPVWSADASTLYYHNGQQVLAVTVQTEPTFRAGPPQVLFDWPYGLTHRFDVSPRDDGFIMIKTDPDSAPNRFHVVLNWSEELRRLVPEQ